MAKIKSLASVRAFGQPPRTEYHSKIPDDNYQEYALAVPKDLYDGVVRAAAARGWSRSQWARETIFAAMEAAERLAPLDPAHPVPPPKFIQILFERKKGEFAHIGFRIFNEDVWRIDQHAWRAGQNRSMWIRECFEAALTRQEAP